MFLFLYTWIDIEIPINCLQKGKAWMTQLVSVACLSLAVKMEETEVPLILDLQVKEHERFECSFDVL